MSRSFVFELGPAAEWHVPVSCKGHSNMHLERHLGWGGALAEGGDRYVQLFGTGVRPGSCWRYNNYRATFIPTHYLQAFRARVVAGR